MGIVESNQKLDELARALNEADSTKKKLQVESQDLTRQIEETDNSIAALQKNKISLTTQLEDTKRLGDGEARDRATLLTKFKNLTTEAENLRMRIDEESDKKNDGLKALSKAQSEIQLWKSKYEVEALGRIDELEGGKQKLASRVAEAEEVIENLNAKIASSEKSKSRMEAEYEELSMEYERTHAAAMITEKRGRNFDKVVGEWKAKADDLMAELDACSSECRNFNAERFRVKAALDETTEQLDIVRRENKNLADEVKDLLDQLGDGGRSIHELDKQRRRLEVGKEELQAALEEAESALEAEENKVLRSQLELGQVKQDVDRKIAEKEDEFNNTRKNHARAMDSMQASLETEQGAKAEALRIKKKLEGEINELEIALDHANKANNEALKSIKRYQGQLREAETQYEEACRMRQEMSERASLADRGKRQTESELSDARSAVNEMGSINSRANSDKRRVEGALHTMQAEIDDLLHQAKNSEEKAKKAMVDAARLADELRSEQDHTTTLSQGKRALETSLGELENRLADANDAAMRGGKSAMAKLESRIRELEIELGNVQSKTGENMKAHQRSERKIKELQFQNDEDRKNQDRMSDLASQLQQKIGTYKKQIEEAEEIAALNLAKFRKAQQELEETEDRARMAENALHAA